MNRPKSTDACLEIKEDYGNVVDTSLNESNLFADVPRVSPQLSSNAATLDSSATAENGSADDSMPKGSSMEKGTLLEQFNQLMNQQNLLLFDGLDKLQQKIEENNNEICKKVEGWMLEVEVMAKKEREEIEAIKAHNRAVMASIKSTSPTVSDGHDTLLTDGHCPTSSSNQVPVESQSNVSSPETVQSPNDSHINKEHLNELVDNEPQLNNEDTSTRVDDVTSNNEKGNENASTERDHIANDSNDQTVAQSCDPFSPSTSTGRRTYRIALKKQLPTASTDHNVTKPKEPSSNRSVKRSKKTIEGDVGEDGENELDRMGSGQSEAEFWFDEDDEDCDCSECMDEYVYISHLSVDLEQSNHSG